jgi:hypothetical protein
MSRSPVTTQPIAASPMRLGETKKGFANVRN